MIKVRDYICIGLVSLLYNSLWRDAMRSKDVEIKSFRRWISTEKTLGNLRIYIRDWVSVHKRA